MTKSSTKKQVTKKTKPKSTTGWGFQDKDGSIQMDVFSSKRYAQEYKSMYPSMHGVKIVKVSIRKHVSK